MKRTKFGLVDNTQSIFVRLYRFKHLQFMYNADKWATDYFGCWIL